MNIAAVKIAQKKAQLSDPDYRALLQRVAGVTSSKQLTDAACHRVLAELYHIAAINAEAEAQRITPPPHRAAPSNPSTAPALRKLWKIWYELQQYLPTQEWTPAYLTGMVRRTARRSDLKRPGDFSTLTPGELHDAIEGLKKRLDQEQKYNQPEIPF